MIGNTVILLMAAMPEHFCMKPLKSWKQLLIRCWYLHVLQGRTICNRQQEVFVSRPFTHFAVWWVKSRLNYSTKLGHVSPTNCCINMGIYGDIHFLLNQPFLLGWGCLIWIDTHVTHMANVPIPHLPSEWSTPKPIPKPHTAPRAV